MARNSELVPQVISENFDIEDMQLSGRKPGIQVPKTSVKRSRKTSSLAKDTHSSDREKKNTQSSTFANDCKICMNQTCNTVLVPCGHKCICLGCSQKIKNICPICRRAVERVVQVYDS